MNNDDKILELKNTIKKKQDELKKSKTKFTPITNCAYVCATGTTNINTCTKQALLTLLVQLHSLEMSTEDLDIKLEEYFVSGFPISDWTTDLKNKLEYLNYKDKCNELVKLEKQLDSLLSSQKQTELKVESIADMIKEL